MPSRTITIDLNKINEISKITPHLCSLSPGGRHFLRAQRGAMGRFSALFVGRTEPDHGAGAYQRRPVGLGPCRVDRLLNLHGVMPIDAADDLPAVCFEARRRVIREPPLDAAVDRNAVVVPERDQLAEPESSGQRAGLVRHAFHQAAIAEEHPRVVVDHLVAAPVEAVAQHLLGQRHTDRVGNTLPKRPGGGLHPGGLAKFRVAGCHRVQLPKILQFRHRQVVTGQVQQAVEQQHARGLAALEEPDQHEADQGERPDDAERRQHAQLRAW